MSQQIASKRPQLITYLLENSLLLIGGAVIALAWANLNEQSYKQFVETDFRTMFSAAVDEGEQHAAKEHASQFHFNLHFLVNGVLMTFFFGIAAKEVFESLLPGGALSNTRKAATPILATAGGVIGPAVLYVAGAYLTGTQDTLGRGWGVPCATDIAFSYMVARVIFGKGHPAIPFLLLLAIADDGAGLVILALFYPTGKLALGWLALCVAAMVLCFVFRALRLHSFWWYILIPGSMSWTSLFMANIEPALGLVPIVFCMPHAHSDLGIFAREELKRSDSLNEFKNWWKNPSELILGMFGLVNAGVTFASIGTGTWLVSIGLIVGKPLGIFLFTFVGVKLLRLELSKGMTFRHIFSLGMVAGIGFTVALFVAGAAFKAPNPMLDSVKMGALFSFFSAPISIVGARLLGVRPESGTGT